MTPLWAYDVAEDGRATPVTDLETAPAGYRWIHADISEPGLEDWLFEHLPERAAEVLVQPETRPRATVHEGGVLFALRGLNLNRGEDPEDMVALRGWATPTLIITTRRRKIFAAQDMRDRAAAGHLPEHPSLLIAEIADNFVDRIEANGVAIEDRVDVLEDILFLDDEAPEGRALPEIRRSAIRLNRFLKPQAAALYALSDARMPVITPEAREDFADAADRMQRAVEELDAVRERLAALTDHLDAARNMRLSRNSYALSIVAAVFLPMGFLTGLFGVNVAGMPGVSAEWAFAVLSLACIGLGALVWIVLRAFRLF